MPYLGDAAQTLIHATINAGWSLTQCREGLTRGAHSCDDLVVQNGEAEPQETILHETEPGTRDHTRSFQ